MSAPGREFLTSGEPGSPPEQAGLPVGSRRRVPGLRRSEVAAPADVSIDYYGKLERGDLAGVSPAVLAVTAGPAFVTNGRLDLLTANQLAHAFFIWVLRGYSGVYAGEETDSCGAGQGAVFRRQ
ncbi:hypothetical protein ACFYO2_48390, partial [Streptomyces sp. NPDC006602]